MNFLLINDIKTYVLKKKNKVSSNKIIQIENLDLSALYYFDSVQIVTLKNDWSQLNVSSNFDN